MATPKSISLATAVKHFNPTSKSTKIYCKKKKRNRKRFIYRNCI